MEKKDSLEFVFIRHAETQYDEYGDRDVCDGKLTAKGEQQCVELGKRLKGLPIDAYITSSLLRAFKTAAGVCNAKEDVPVLEICPELIECDSTAGYYGCSVEYLKGYYSKAKMCDTKLYGTEDYDFSSTTEDAPLRAAKVMDYLKSRFTFGDRVAVFSHNGILQELIPTALGVECGKFKLFLNNTSITVVEYLRDGRCVLRCLNN